MLVHAYRYSINDGFTGVDVFFPISGYLITYSRRICHIFPPLLLVLTFTLVVGCVWLPDKSVQSMTITLGAGTQHPAADRPTGLL
ncbi:hypothetical protein H257_15993 [Aphanomyces astaci]|uniref:Uncharacterized protein n=1 Tax=Aphanomyces astaci TaxID=112090 RepID=W4FM21_APHAT|nr:hypothetical protein H257_15993 [Aphanomyces astaci]ETV67869.1 hypothetical protein H257_15993 [Aphanomyces astaci]|eukprot:XP_009842614.1 hypothetical protein H257_15993 [Aphanomyces astaci]